MQALVGELVPDIAGDKCQFRAIDIKIRREPLFHLFCRERLFGFNQGELVEPLPDVAAATSVEERLSPFRAHIYISKVAVADCGSL